jgi:hypothetical protein
MVTKEGNSNRTPNSLKIFDVGKLRSWPVRNYALRHLLCFSRGAYRVVVYMLGVGSRQVRACERVSE